MRSVRKLLTSGLLVAIGLAAAATASEKKSDQPEKPPDKKAKKPRSERRPPQPGFRAPLGGPRGPGDIGPGRGFLRGRNGGGIPGEGDRPPPRFMLSQEELEEMTAFVREHFPEQYEKLRRLHGKDKLRPIAAKLWPRIREIILAYRRNPELGNLMVEDLKLEEQFREKFQSYRGASKESRKQIEDEIRTLLARQFDVRQKRRAVEIHELEKRLADQKRILEERSAHKDDIITRELDRRLHPEREF